MKCFTACIVLLIAVLTGCSSKMKEYPDIKLAQIAADIKWGADIKDVKTLLKSKYKFEFIREISQSKSSGRVLEFAGGKIEGQKTHSWEACFDKDSLVFLAAKIESGSAAESEEQIQSIKGGIGKLSFARNSNAENEWIFYENEKVKCTLLLEKYEKGISLLFSSGKFVKPKSIVQTKQELLK